MKVGRIAAHSAYGPAERRPGAEIAEAAEGRRSRRRWRSQDLITGPRQLYWPGEIIERRAARPREEQGPIKGGKANCDRHPVLKGIKARCRVRCVRRASARLGSHPSIASESRSCRA